MSTPRLCDSCGDIFSELEEGWTTSTQTQVQSGEHGESRNVSVRVDACPECSPKTSDTLKKLRAHRRSLRTAQLELEAGIGADTLEDRIAAEEKTHGSR